MRSTDSSRVEGYFLRTFSLCSRLENWFLFFISLCRRSAKRANLFFSSLFLASFLAGFYIFLLALDNWDLNVIRLGLSRRARSFKVLQGRCNSAQFVPMNPTGSQGFEWDVINAEMEFDFIRFRVEKVKKMAPEENGHATSATQMWNVKWNTL